MSSACWRFEFVASTCYEIGLFSLKYFGNALWVVDFMDQLPPIMPSGSSLCNLSKAVNLHHFSFYLTKTDI